MNVWRLVAHHENPADAIAWSIAAGRIAVGWGKLGDLRILAPRSANEITGAINKAYPVIQNAHLGGPSLWNFLELMEIGDLAIVSGGGLRAHVVEITGDYTCASPIDSFGDYFHQRAAVVTSYDADDLWSSFGGKVATGNNVRWTVALCDAPQLAGEVWVEQTYSEGTRFEVTASVIERNPAARDACLRYHGVRCAACNFDFAEQYGEIGSGFIHVHHLSPLSAVTEVRQVDPARDLIPLCPNCHAMVHRTRPPLTIEALRLRIQVSSHGS
jgi:hypothetical protein